MIVLRSSSDSNDNGNDKLNNNHNNHNNNNNNKLYDNDSPPRGRRARDRHARPQGVLAEGLVWFRV